jgi:ketosteroid isomerase-like protein
MTDADMAAAQAVLTKWREAILAKDWATFARLYTGDAVLMPPNAPSVVGPAAIALFFANPGITVQAFTPRAEAVEGGGALATMRTSYAMTVKVPGADAPLTECGKGLLVLRRAADGAWQIAIDIWNADGPPAP